MDRANGMIALLAFLAVLAAIALCHLYILKRKKAASQVAVQRQRAPISNYDSCFLSFV